MDEWDINSHGASLIALPATYNRSDYFDDVQAMLESIGYVNSYNNHSTIDNGITEAEMLNILKTSRITLIRSHGNKTFVTVTGGYLSTGDLGTLSTDYLSDSDLIIYGACSTAQGGKTDSSNLVNTTVSVGARTVIGFEKSVDASACNYWCLWFFTYLKDYYKSEDKTLIDVCKETDTQAKNNHTYYEYTTSTGSIVSLRNYVIAGDSSMPY